MITGRCLGISSFWALNKGKSNYPVIGIQTLIKTIYTHTYSTSLIENIFYKNFKWNAEKMTKLDYQHVTNPNETESRQRLLKSFGE